MKELKNTNPEVNETVTDAKAENTVTEVFADEAAPSENAGTGTLGGEITASEGTEAGTSGGEITALEGIEAGTSAGETADTERTEARKTVDPETGEIPDGFMDFEALFDESENTDMDEADGPDGDGRKDRTDGPDGDGNKGEADGMKEAGSLVRAGGASQSAGYSGNGTDSKQAASGTGKDDRDEITFEIKAHFGILGDAYKGRTLELNLVSWNGGYPKFDIRSWDHIHRHMSKGITLKYDEAARLRDLLNNVDFEKLNERRKKAVAGRKTEKE